MSLDHIFPVVNYTFCAVFRIYSFVARWMDSSLIKGRSSEKHNANLPMNKNL
jgi:hypothetical protein